jgi:predicted GNAT family acetyltransferase
MKLEMLDNPIWFALSTHQKRFALQNSLARCFPSDMNRFGAIQTESTQGLQDLVKLLPDKKPIAWFTDLEISDFPGGIELVVKLSVSQMICQNLAPTPELAMRVLTQEDVPAMLELVELTKPGPFSARSIELGEFWGIVKNGSLLAMAGERLQMPGFTEVSGVCTHPNYRSQGLARALMARVCQAIFARGEIPFLHVMTNNLNAIRTYEQLGFYERKKIFGYVLRAKTTEVKR